MKTEFTGTWKNDLNKTIFTISDGTFTQSYYDEPNLYFFKGTWDPHGDTKIILTYTHESKDGVTALDDMPLVEGNYKNWLFEPLASNKIKLIPEGHEEIYANIDTDIYNCELDIYTKEENKDDN